MLDILADASQIQGAFEALLQELKKEAEACAHCQPNQGKYEELAKEWEAYRSEMYDTPGGKQLFGILEALRTGNWNGPAPPTDEELQQLDMQRIRNRVAGHCGALYDPGRRLDLLAPPEKRQIQLDPIVGAHWPHRGPHDSFERGRFQHAGLNLAGRKAKPEASLARQRHEEQIDRVIVTVHPVGQDFEPLALRCLAHNAKLSRAVHRVHGATIFGVDAS